MGLGDLFEQALGEHGDTALEGIDGLLEAADVRLGVGEEQVEEVCEFLGIAETEAGYGLLVLVEDGTAGVFEDGVGERIAATDFAEDFGVELVAGVLGLPVAAGEVVAVPEGSVRTDEPVADP